MDARENIYENKRSLVNFNEHVKEENFIVNVSHLTYNQKTKINEIIEKYKSAFAKDKYDVGSVDKYEAQIDLTVDKYCTKRPYKCTEQDKRERSKNKYRNY